jgi:hypothetical protein
MVTINKTPVLRQIYMVIATKVIFKIPDIGSEDPRFNTQLGL